MTKERTPTLSSRRAVLAAGVASAAAVVAAAVGRVTPTSAATDGQPVLLGQDQEATEATEIRRTSSGPVIVGNASGPGIGLSGFSQTGLGMQGTAETGLGVLGSSKTGTGVEAASRDGIALHIRRGRLRFDGISGQATIRPGDEEVIFGIPSTTFGGAFMLMTPRSDLGGRDLWYTIQIAEATATIHISSPHESAVRVGWLLVG